MRACALWLILSLVLAGLPDFARAGDEVFFEQLPEGYEAAIRRCVDEGACEGIAALNPGPQYVAVTIWGRRISDAFPVERVKGGLVADAAALERLIGRYYRWPEDVPKRGEIDVLSLPGVGATEGQDMVLALAPEKSFARALSLGGRRIVAPEEFDMPGQALFGELRARFDTAFGAPADTGDGLQGRFDGAFGVQSGLWQARTGIAFATDDGPSVSYAYAERPILSRALRLRAGFTGTIGCDICFSGPMVGVTLASDSLQGLLYSPADTAYLDVTVGGEIDEIETVVNGRSVRIERAFPGFHTVAATSLVDGLNIIEIFGIDRDSGRRRLLASEERIASPALLGKGRAEWTAEAGWALGDNSFAFGDDPDWLSPFAQVTRRTGLGGGRELGTKVFLTTDGVVAENAVTVGLGKGRLGLAAIGSLSGSGAGGGGGLSFADRFGAVQVGAGATLCYDCFDAGTFAVTDGLDARVQASLSTALMGWTASASVSYSTDANLGWNATLRRSAFGGNLELYARQTTAVADADDPAGADLALGLRFTKILGGERPTTVATGFEEVDGRLVGRAAYDSAPPRGEGVFYGASVESDDLFAAGASGTRVAAGLGHQDDILLASGSASYSDATGATALNLSAATGFVWTDGDLVLTRTARSGGVFASGLAPGSAIIGDAGEIGVVDPFGQAHLNSLARGEKSRVVLDEGAVDGGTASREAELLVVPGLIYGIGERYRREERSYRLVIGAERAAPPPGTVLVDEEGTEVGYAGYDGIVTLDRPARELVFEAGEQTCRVGVTGKEPVADDGLALLVADCTAKAGPGG